MCWLIIYTKQEESKKSTMIVHISSEIDVPKDSKIIY